MPLLFCLRLHQTGLKPIQDGNLEPLYIYEAQLECWDSLHKNYSSGIVVIVNSWWFVEYLELVDLEVVDLAEYFNSTFLKSKKLSSAWGDQQGVVSSFKKKLKKLYFALERGSNF